MFLNSAFSRVSFDISVTRSPALIVKAPAAAAAAATEASTEAA